MTAPTFVQEAETAWNSSTTPKTTASFNVLGGDILVAFSIAADSGGVQALGVSGGSLTWTQRASVITSSFAQLTIWTAPVDVDKAMTVSFTLSAGWWFGGNVLTFRNSDGVGAAPAGTTGTTGAPSTNITTTQADSAIVLCSGDWNAINGASRTWLANAGALTEQTYFRDAAMYSLYGGYHANAGAIGTYAVGLSAPTGQKWSAGAVEIKGTAGGGAPDVTGILRPLWTPEDGVIDPGRVAQRDSRTRIN